MAKSCMNGCAWRLLSHQSSIECSPIRPISGAARQFLHVCPRYIYLWMLKGLFMDVCGEHVPVLQPQLLAHVGEHLPKVPRSLVHLGLRPMHSHRIRKRQPHVVRKVCNGRITALPESSKNRTEVHPMGNYVVWRTLLGARKVLAVAPPARSRVQGLFGI
jgi:hypothetical protein